MAMDFQLASSFPQIEHFPRYFTFLPSWPMITAPRPAVARADRVGAAGRGATGAAAADSAGAGSPAAGVAGRPASCDSSTAGLERAATSATADTSRPGNSDAPAPGWDALAGKRTLNLAAGTPFSRPSSQMISVGKTLPDAASSASSFPETGPLISEPRP